MQKRSTEKMNYLEVFNRLHDLIVSRKKSVTGKSYTEELFRKGQDHLLKKLGEEALEVMMASKDDDSDHVVRELADLWFHSMVVMAYHDISMGDVASELERREGISGLEEKAGRK